jgi:hypothetical protein
LNTKHEIILPHENGQDVSTKDIIRDCDLVVAEVSTPGFGQGIELGWANDAYVSIICFYKQGSEISNSLQYISDSIFPYDSMDAMIKKIAEVADTL